MKFDRKKDWNKLYKNSFCNDVFDLLDRNSDLYLFLLFLLFLFFSRLDILLIILFFLCLLFCLSAFCNFNLCLAFFDLFFTFIYVDLSHLFEYLGLLRGIIQFLIDNRWHIFSVFDLNFDQYIRRTQQNLLLIIPFMGLFRLIMQINIGGKHFFSFRVPRPHICLKSTFLSTTSALSTVKKSWQILCINQIQKLFLVTTTQYFYLFLGFVINPHLHDTPNSSKKHWCIDDEHTKK